MSGTISGPWILDFLISVAEEHGGNLTAAPPRKKAAKAQLVQFLTFPDSDSAPCNIWVEISDKKHIIHARLSQDAVARYLQHPLYAGKSLTSHKSALVSLQRVRVAFGRVPSRESKGMTKDGTLFLDVEEFELKGAFGQAVWDSPVDIASDKNIRDWIQGLRQDGGAGNILKQRKAQAASATELAKKARTTTAESHIQTTMDAMNVKVRVARKSGPRVSSGAKHTASERPTVNKEALRKASWKRFHAKVINYFCPPDEVLEHLFTLCGERLPRPALHRGSPKRPGSRSPGSQSSRRPTKLSLSPPASSSASSDERRVRIPQSSPPRSPSNWSPSVAGSPRQSNKDSSDTEEEPEDAKSGTDTDSDDAADERIVHDTSSTKLGTHSPKSPKFTHDHDSPSLTMPPPPAQPRRRPPPSSVPYATSSPQPPVPSANAEHADSLPPSSLPAPVSSLRFLPSPASSPPFPASTPAWSANGVRRVPLPQIGTLQRDPDSSGEGRVLVENSDTASPASQRIASFQSQSQSQSQNQSQNRSQDSQEHGQSSMSQPSSKLRNEVGAVEVEIEENPRKSERPESPHGAEGPAAPELDEESQESVKSRQSLSYKGDSQSQDKPEIAQTASETRVQVSAEVEAHGDPVTVDDVRDAPDVDVKNAGDNVLQPEPSSVASAMSVDPGPRPQASQDVPDASEPTWAAIRATTTPEDGGDSEADVDELLSDPLAAEQETPAPPRQSRGRKAKGHAAQADPVRLDPDDARTAAMVDRYVSQTNQSARKPRRSGVRESSPVKRRRQSTPVVEEQPQSRASKRRRREDDASGQQVGPSLPAATDVFTNEDSFREEQSEQASKPVKRPAAPSREEEHEPAATSNGRRSNGARSQDLAHDPSVWAAPTFMRKPNGPMQTSSKAGVSAAHAGKVAPSKKRAAGASLSTQDEQPAAKKRKTSSAAIPVAATINAVAKDTGGMRKPITSMTGSTQWQSRKVPAGSSSTVPQPPAPSQGTVAHNGSKDVKYVDLRAVSRSTSRSSSRAPQAGNGVPRPSDVPHGTSVPASTSSKGKAPMRSVKREDAEPLRPSQVLPVLSGAKSVATQNAMRSSTSVSRRAPPPQSAAAVSEADTRGIRDSRADATRQLLNEYRTALQPTRTPGGPPLLGWDDLAEILVETGRARTELERAATSNDAGLPEY